MEFFYSFRVNLMWTQSKKNLSLHLQVVSSYQGIKGLYFSNNFPCRDGEIQLAHKQMVEPWNLMNFYSYYFYLYCSSAKTVETPLCYGAQEVCKQSNWHFLMQTVSCLFLLLLQHHSAKFQSLQTFLLEFIMIIIMPELVRHCLKSNLCENNACTVSPLHHKNHPSSWILQFILLLMVFLWFL